jgi:hypothetical protein
VTPLPALVSLIEARFEGILNWSQIECRSDEELVDDPSHGYKFHSPFRKIRHASDEVIRKAQVDHRRKVDYLLAKFYDHGKQAGKVLYIYKHDGPEQGAELRALLSRVSIGLLDIAGDNNFQFVVAQHEERQEPDWGDPVIKNRYLKRIAPWADATDGHVRSWDFIFKEFPNQAGLTLSNY